MHTEKIMRCYKVLLQRNIGKSEKAGRGRGRSHLTTLETESKKTSPLPGLPLCCAHFGLSGAHGLQLLSGGQQYPFCDPCTCGIGGVIETEYSCQGRNS